MNEQTIIQAIDAELNRLQQVRDLLASVNTTKIGILRRAKKTTSTGTTGTKPAKKRTMSAVGRARIAAAQKKRWAQMKKLSSASAVSKKASSKKATKNSAKETEAKAEAPF
jgi:hypothetical protein